MKGPIKFILDCLKPFKGWIAVQFFVAIVVAFDVTLKPYLLKLMVDGAQSASQNGDISAVTWSAGSYLLLALFVALIYLLYDYVLIHINPPLKRYIGDALMTRMMGHSQSLFQEHYAGSLGDKVKEVMMGIPELLQFMIDQFFSHGLALIIALVAMGMVDIRFAIIFSAWLFLFTFGSIYFSHDARKLSKDVAEEKSQVMGRIVDILTNIKGVRLFLGARYESKKLHRVLNRYVERDQALNWCFLKLFAFQGISFVLYQIFCIIGLIWGLKEGTLSAGDFVMILTLNMEMITLLWPLTQDIRMFVDLLGNIFQGLNVALLPVNIKDQDNAKILDIKEGEIVFEDVLFGYGEEAPLFKKQSLTIRSGEKVGLVGPSGGGKSTFISLILRLYDLQEGRILIDGQDVRCVTQDSLYSAIGVIPQDPSLFHRSVLENIRYGRQDATDEDVIEAAKQAQAHDFIMALPQGYDTLVGERGGKLSGGQRQRIAMARALVKKAKIWVLDEATSQLDAATEKAIQDSLSTWMKGTTIVIAHHLSTLLSMDRILVLEKGLIIEDGTHEELLKRNGLYKHLWDAQVGGILPMTNAVQAA